MRRKIELYINGELADINTDALVLMNYKQSDASAPAAVYNSWSQNVALPRTSHNARIFGHIERTDRTTADGFNALIRTPFVIYNEKGEILESGYAKLNDITPLQYSLTLYGGLGGFLYGLMYNADGSKRSLADLVYTSGGDENELDFQITRVAVRDAWRQIADLETTDAKWDVINFAPAYNGLPSGDFDAKKAFVSTNCYGVDASREEGGVTYTSKRGHVLAELANEVDEWASGDLRSYLQRPVVRMKAVIDAICNTANNGGFSVNLDSSFFNEDNPYYDKTWLTLPRLDGIKIPTEMDSEHLTWSHYTSWQPYYMSSWPSSGSKGSATKYSIRAEFLPVAELKTALSSAGTRKMGYADLEWGDRLPQFECERVVVFAQLLAYDHTNTLIGGSKVVSIQSAIYRDDPHGTGAWPETITTQHAMELTDFVPLWNPTGELADIAGEEIIGDFSFEANVKEGTFTGDNVTLECEAYDVDHVAIYIAPNIHRYYSIIPPFPALPDRLYSNSAGSYDEIKGYTAREQPTDDNTIDYQSSGNVRSGVKLTKQTLLGGTDTPADYLLSYCKMFGLHLAYDSASKRIDILTRSNFFSGGVVDLEDRIDPTTIKSIPYYITSRWYDFVNPAEGSFADYYKSIHGKDYGMARINTGYEFNADHNDVLKDCIFKGAADVLHHNKFMVNIFQNDKVVPPPFIDGGQYTLWDASNNEQTFDIVTPSDDAAIHYLNESYKGYDWPLFSRAEFCDKDGKALEGKNVLLMYDMAGLGDNDSRYTLTDDSPLMMLYNGGQPCWLMGQQTILSNKPYTINEDGEDDSSWLYLPRFRRMMAGATTPMEVSHSLDMAIPQEVDIPAITIPSGVDVYSRGWEAYVNDRMNVDTKVVTCKVLLRGLGGVGQNLLRQFYYFGGSVWILNQIKNYILEGDSMTECEFIKVTDKANYNNGQNY